jgi:hypothetical protein
MKKEVRKPKCRICGKTIHRGGVHLKVESGQMRHFHKACRTKLLSQSRRVYGKKGKGKYPKEPWEK